MQGFGVATDCGWGRGGSAAVDQLLELHRATCERLDVPGRKTAFVWPAGFDRIPDEDWTRAPLSEAGLAYDHVDEHGWYDNLNPSVEQLAAHLQDGDILVDYSGGTGILLDRLRLRIFDRAVGTIVVDASAKFLRVAHEKYKDDPRFAARLLRFIKEEKRLQSLDEVLGPELLERGVDAIAAVNAIHLYPDLDEVAVGLGARAEAGRQGVHQLRQPAQPEREARRVDPRRDGLGHQRPRREPRAQRPGLRAVPRGARRHASACRPITPTATACSCSRARWSTTPTRWRATG